MAHIRLIILLISIMFPPAGLIADSYSYKQISVREGLSQSMGKSICYDHSGFLWIGTNNGLNRFDGNELRSYFSDPEIPNSISHNNIHFVVEDSVHNVWVGTSHSVLKYDLQQDGFLPINREERNTSYRTCLVRKHDVIFGRGDRLLIYDYQKQTYRTLFFKGECKDLLFLYKIIPYSNSHLLLGSRWKGLFVCNLQTGELTKCRFYPENNVAAICRDREDNLWISPFDDGIYCYDRRGYLKGRYTVDNSRLSSNRILDMMYEQGKLWIATDGGGLNIMDPHTGEFDLLENKPEDTFSLPANSIRSLYADYYGNIWLGTIRRGVLGIKKTFIQSYGNTLAGASNGLSEPTVNCLYEDAGGTIWIGTDGGGINGFNPETNKFRHFPNTFRKKISSVTTYSEEELLLGIYGEQFQLFNKTTGSLRPLLSTGNSVKKENGISNQCFSLNKDSILLTGDSLCIWNIRDKSVRRLASPVREVFYKITESPLEKKFFLFNNHEVFRLDPRTARIDTVFYAEDRRDWIINAVECDFSGRIWLGTSQGLFLVKDPDTVQEIPTNLFKHVTILQQGADEELWIGSAGKLYRYFIRENRFLTYKETDGVIPNEFLERARLLSSEGFILMGGVSGLVKIKPEISSFNSVVPEVRIADLKINGSRKPEIKISEDAPIVLNPDYTSLEIKLMVNDPDIFTRPILRYYLEGHHDAPLVVSDYTVNFQNLKPGTYTLKGSCMKADGQWGPLADILTVTVKPHWWQTVWFYLTLLILFLSVTALLAFYSKRKHLRQLQHTLQKQKDEMNEDKIRFLININHELRTPLTLITAPLARLLNNKEIRDPEIRHTLTNVSKHAKHMKSMIDMILDIRKMEVTREKLDLRRISLNQWLGEVVEEFADEYGAKGIRLILKPDESIEELVLDPDKCRKIMNNLLFNALKFSSAGETVTVRSEEQHGFVRISVMDEGIGFGSTDPQTLFNRYFRSDKQKDGYGIGLSYSKILTEMHGGHIDAIANPAGKGALFFFEIPKRIIEPGDHDHSLNRFINEVAEPSLPEVPDNTAPGILKNKRILIAEDEPDLRQYLKQELSEFAEEVFACANGAEALEKCREIQPDLVISDIMMPVMDGFEFCRRLKQDTAVSHIPIILLTAYATHQGQSLGYKMGADGYLTKPFDLEILLNRSCSILEARERIREQYRNASPSQPAAVAEITHSEADEQFLNRLTELVNQHLAEPYLDVDFLVDKMAISRSAFYVKMKSITGTGIKEFINKIRINRAMLLLQDPDIPIVEVSERTGFNNQRYFSTAFKQMTGKTPSKYREEWGKNVSLECS